MAGQTMKESNLIAARRPVVIYTSGGIGDHLAALPALRALVHLFPDKLALICIPGSTSVLFSEIGLRSVHEVEFFDLHGVGIQMSRFPKTAPLPGWLTCEESVFVETVPGKQPAGLPAQEAFWTFDAQAVADQVGDCDVLISLTPWHSPSADRLLAILSPVQSIGFSVTFKTPLTVDFKRNLADIFFRVASSLDPSLKIEDFVGMPVVPAKYRETARIIRSQLPDGFRILAVHVDTTPPKMWSPERFINVIDKFLDRHSDFAALVLGCPDVRWARGLCGNRVVHCFPLELPTSLALVAETDLFLGVDSCMLHCADLHLIPGVGLFGPTDYSTWGFRFARHRHVRGNGTMESISEAEVLDALEFLVLSQ
jgi:Glycosyltransferase family 9 (heptosyltransferase)